MVYLVANSMCSLFLLFNICTNFDMFNICANICTCIYTYIFLLSDCTECITILTFASKYFENNVYKKYVEIKLI